MATRCTWAGRVCTTTGETRRFAIDFEDLEELTDNGESLTGTPLVEAIDPASGVTVSGAAIDGTAVGFDSEATKVGTWTIRVTVDTTGGATLVRTMTVEVEAQ
jgi:hypothetical protein